MAKRARETGKRALARIHFDHRRPVPGPDDGPLLLWDILEREIPSHADLETLVSYGETAKRLANVWQAHIKKLPYVVLCRARGKLRVFPNLTHLCIPEVEYQHRLTPNDVMALSLLETLDASNWNYAGPDSDEAADAIEEAADAAAAAAENATDALVEAADAAAYAAEIVEVTTADLAAGASEAAVAAYVAAAAAEAEAANAAADAAAATAATKAAAAASIAAGTPNDDINLMLTHLPNLIQVAFSMLETPLAVFSNLPRLRELALSNCVLSRADGRGIFQNLSSLVALDLHAVFTEAPHGDLLVSCPDLLHLNFAHNTVAPEVLAPLVNLTYLDVRYCDALTDDCLAPLVALRVLLLAETRQFADPLLLRPLVALEMVFWAQWTAQKRLPYDVAALHPDLSWTICESPFAEDRMYPLFVRQTRRRGMNPFFDFIDNK